MKRRSVIFGLFVMMFLATACGGASQITSTTTNSEHTGGSFSKILVIGVTSNTELKQAFESQFAALLSQREITATQGFSYLFPENMEDKEKLVAQIKQGDFDAVLITSLKRVDEEYMLKHEPSAGVRGGGNLGAYYETLTKEEAESLDGNVVKNVTVVLETALYAVEDEKQVWLGESETFNPNAEQREENIRQLAELIIKQLSQEKLIQ